MHNALNWCSSVAIISRPIHTWTKDDAILAHSVVLVIICRLEHKTYKISSMLALMIICNTVMDPSSVAILSYDEHFHNT